MKNYEKHKKSQKINRVKKGYSTYHSSYHFSDDPPSQDGGCYFLRTYKNSNVFFSLMEKPSESTFQLGHTKRWQKG